MRDFFLIAGTLHAVRAWAVARHVWLDGVWRLVWALALIGVLFKVVARFRLPYVSTALYLGMGWLAVFMIRPLAMTHLPVSGARLA